MSRGYVNDGRDIAFQRFLKFNEHNPTIPEKPKSFSEQEKLAHVKLRQQIQKEEKLLQERLEIGNENNRSYIVKMHGDFNFNKKKMTDKAYERQVLNSFKEGFKKSLRDLDIYFRTIEKYMIVFDRVFNVHNILTYKNLTFKQIKILVDKYAKEKSIDLENNES